MSLEIQKIAPKCVPHFSCEKLSEKEIEKKKTALIRRQLTKIEKTNPYCKADKEKNLWMKRMFFLKYQNNIFLCGICSNHPKRDTISNHRIKMHSISDYILFSRKIGFYIIKDCEDANLLNPDDYFYMPTIYYSDSMSDNQWSRLASGKTYDESNLEHILVKRTEKTYLPTEGNPLNAVANHEIDIILDADIIMEISCGFASEELPLESNWIIGMHDYGTGFLLNWENNEKIELRWYNNRFPFDLRYTTESAMINCANNQLKSMDENNYYFYISMSNSVAFVAIMRCIAEFGNYEVMNNMFSLDSSVNLKLSVPKSGNSDAVSFIIRTILKSKSVKPQIFGCSIHDVVELLCKKSYNPYELPAHSIDEISAKKVIQYIYTHTEFHSAADIIRALIATYGECSISAGGYEYSYMADSGIQTDIFPKSMETTVGWPMNSKFLEILDNSVLPDKWKSEAELYYLVKRYYPKAVAHYMTPWLGNQHLDIYIPNKRIGIEYQGLQHYEDLDYFGGSDGFAERKVRDTKKKDLCIENNVSLLEWPYTLPITAINFIVLLKEFGIDDIPNPTLIKGANEVEQTI